MVSPAADTQVIVVGAGPAGLAVGACLRHAGVPHRILEREAAIGSAWRRHYDRLHLHTSRSSSSLPFHPMPRWYPRYPSRDQVVEYLEEYVRVLGLTPCFGVEVRRIVRDGDGWIIQAGEESLRCSALVIATGANGTPKIPAWPGLEDFPGTVLHSSEFRSGAAFEGCDVLVVGFGNSGAEIALDLAEHRARPVVSVRSPVNIIPRDVLGMPVVAISAPLAQLPPRVADLLVWALLKVYYPSYASLGLEKAPYGPFTQIEEKGRLPVLDIGTVAGIRSGRIHVEVDVERIVGSQVRFRNGHARDFHGIVLATGFEPSLPEGIRDGRGVRPEESAPGLYLCGFRVSPGGVLREIGREASRIVADIAGRERRLPERRRKVRR